MNKKNIDKFITEALAIESEEAKKAGALGYMARALVQATMPHKNPGLVEVWGRRNGNFSMAMQPGYVIDKNNNSKNKFQICQKKKQLKQESNEKNNI